MGIMDDEFSGNCQRNFQTLFETMPQGVLFFNRHGKITAANPAAERILGVPLDEMIGKTAHDPMWDVINEDGSPCSSEEYPTEVALRTCRDSAGRILGVWNPEEKRRRWISVDASVQVSEDEDEPHQVFALFGDVTERLSIQQELKDTLQNEQELCLLLQRALLPDKFCTIDGYNVSAKNVAAFRDRLIGGDFYDVFRTEDKNIGIMIGDVSGKGLESASFATTARSTIRAFAYELHSAGDALTHSNAVLCSRQAERSEYGIFITLFLMMLHPATGKFDFVSAGHPPPVIWRANGEIKFLSLGQLPVGLVEDEEYRHFKDRLNPGDKMFLYTDGVTESKHYRTEKMFELEGVKRTLEQHGELSASDLLDLFFRTVQKWAGGEFRDDTAVMIIERDK